MNPERTLLDAREIGTGVKSYDNVIPRLRDRKSNPIPRRYVSGPTLVTTDPEALLDSARAYATSPQEGAKLYPWLKSRAALAADANMRQVRDEMYARMEAANQRVSSEVDPIQSQLELADTRVQALAPEAIRTAGELGLAREPGQRLLPLLAHEPVTLEEIAGEHGVLMPEAHSSWWTRSAYKLVSALGGGGLFGLSLGLLADKIELVDLAEEWPVVAVFVVFGILLMSIVGAVIWPISKSIGGMLFRRLVRLPAFEPWLLGFKISFVFAFVALAIVIESKVEQFGLLKVVSESTTLRGIVITRAEMLWVSLMLIVPVAAFYLVSGLCEGERVASANFLQSEHAKRRRQLVEQPRFGKAVEALEELASAVEHRNAIASQVEQLKSRLRYELTLEERYRLEDLQMDVIRYSQEAEDAMLAAGSSSGSWFWAFQKRPFWKRWGRR
jgi:hypothetical protein